MRFKAWTKIEQSNLFRKAKVKFRQIKGAEPKIGPDVELEIENYSDWDVVPSLLNENDIFYSFGICDDIGFELLACEKKVSLFAFDPTPYSVDWVGKQQLPLNFHFNPWAVSGIDKALFLCPRTDNKGKKSSVMYTFHKEEGAEDDCIEVEALSLKTIANKLGHSKIDVLKMDIEGSEYEVVENLLKSAFKPKMILIEFHHRFKGVGKDKTVMAVKGLREAGYLIASVSLDNTEFCFVHKTTIENNHAIQANISKEELC